MKKIRLERIEIRNFKGTRHADIRFGDAQTIISGRNGAGKTTVYDAFLWCLFGKTSGINQTIQPLDEENELIHHLDTSVKAELSVDGEKVVLSRAISEKWRNLGTPEEKFIGTEIQRFYNDVPLSMKEYNAKLDAILSIDKWALFSDIGAFMAMKMEDRRKMLIEIAGMVDENTLLSPYPELKKAIVGKTIEELTKQTKATKKKSETERTAIPNMIKAQDDLRVVLDFDKIASDKAAIEKEIDDIDILLQGSTEELEEERKYRNEMDRLNGRLNDAMRDNHDKHQAQKLALVIAENEAERKQREVNTYLAGAQEQQKKVLREQSSLDSDIKMLIEKWRAVNKEIFEFTESTVCPVCGREFTAEMRREEKEHAVMEFNTRKSKTLNSIAEEVKKKRQEYDELGYALSEISQKVTLYEEEVAAATKSVVVAREAVEKFTYNETPEILALREQLNGLKRPSKNDNNADELKAKKRNLTEERDKLTRALAGMGTNKLIEKKKEELTERLAELGQIVADCDNILYQVAAYKKSKIEAVEGKVNSLFKFAQWKFYEKNATNDDLQEVCTCVIGGVDYTNLNSANKVNVGIDIVNGLTAASNVSIPLFIDGRESVIDIIPSDNQLISLVVKDTQSETLSVQYV